jgi:hypothetical protein
MFYVPDLFTTGVLYIQYGQVYYDSLEIAKTHLYDNFTQNPNLNFTTFRGWIIVQKETTELNNATQCYIKEAPKMGIKYIQEQMPIVYGSIVDPPFIPSATGDLTLSINKVYVTDDQKSAADAANAPGPANAFATMNDIPTLPEEIMEAASSTQETAAFAAGAKIVIRTDLL